MTPNVGPEIWMSELKFAVKFQGLDKSLKLAHHAISVFIGLDNPVTVQVNGTQVTGRCVLLKNDVQFEIPPSENLVFMCCIDPGEAFGRVISESRFQNGDYYTENDGLTDKLVSPYLDCPWQSDDDFEKFYNAILLHVIQRCIEDRLLDPRISEVIKFIRSAPEENRTTTGLAKKVHMSKSHLAQIFKEEVGMPTGKYATWVRLMRASQRIFEGMKITDAAHRFGFSDTAHLSRSFSEQWGGSPSTIAKRRFNVRRKSDNLSKEVA